MALQSVLEKEVKLTIGAVTYRPGSAKGIVKEVFNNRVMLLVDSRLAHIGLNQIDKVECEGRVIFSIY